MKKPNVLFILQDHQLYHGHENSIIHPYYDKFKTESTSFDNAYSVCPLCGPARRTMLTGLYPHNHKEIHCSMNHPYDKEIYHDILAKSSYNNFYYGKWHAGSGNATDHSCISYAIAGNAYGNPYLSEDYKSYLEKHNLPFAQVRIEHNFCEPDRYTDVLAGSEYTQDKPACNEDMSGVMITPKETHEAFFISDMVCEKLEQLVVQDEPFNISVNFWGPHQPYFPTQEYIDLYDEHHISISESFSEDVKTTKPQTYHYSRYREISDNHKLLHPSKLHKDIWERTMLLAYAQATMVDEAAGKILKKLDDMGLAENTLVIWTADHGDAISSHGGHFNKGAYLTQEVLRIPLSIRYPNIIPSANISDRLVSNLDVATTIINATGLEFRNDVDGVSLLNQALDIEPEREYVVAETYGLFEKHFGRAVITKEFKYVYNLELEDELYDIQKDKFELCNLVNDNSHSEVLEKMRTYLFDFAKKSNDDFMLSLCYTSHKFNIKLKESNIFELSCPWWR